MSRTLLQTVDHLIFACDDLHAGISIIKEKLGIEAKIAGRHPAFGTWNALFSLGKYSYFEIIAPDLDRDPGLPISIFNMNQFTEPQLIGWMAKENDIEKRLAFLKTKKIDLGEFQTGKRQKPDGSFLSWNLSNPFKVLKRGLVPHLIDWGDIEHHPSQTTVQGCQLVDVKIQCPDSSELNEIYAWMDIPLKAHKSYVSRMTAIISSPLGIVEIY